MQHSTGVVLTLDEAHVAHREDLGALGAAPTQVWPALRRPPVKAKSVTNADRTWLAHFRGNPDWSEGRSSAR
jgi:hypothetical protein